MISRFTRTGRVSKRAGCLPICIAGANAATVRSTIWPKFPSGGGRFGLGQRQAKKTKHDCRRQGPLRAPYQANSRLKIQTKDLDGPAVQRMIGQISIGATAATVKTARGKARVSGGAPAAARVAELLGGMWTWGERNGLVGDTPNPVRGVQKFKCEPRDRPFGAR